MNETNIYRDIAERTDGAFMLGVVGPVRTGKSTFIKRFMEMMVIPQIDNTYMRERAKDELPQSGSGKTIMTAEPKFVPEDAVTVSFGEGAKMSVRLVDCVGYMVDGAAGQFEDGSERLVTTPWFDHEISMTEAAEKGTYKVITEHSTIGIVVTTDGSVCDIPREKYIEPERRVVTELKNIGKPFVILLNSAYPDAPETKALADELSEEYGVRCMCVNCLKMTEKDISQIMQSVLEEFPFKAVGIFLPEWLDALPEDNELKTEMYSYIMDAYADAEKIFRFLTVFEHTSSKYWTAMGSVQQVQGRYDEAIKAYQMASFLDLHNPKPMYYAAECFVKTGDLDNARKALASLEQYGPTDTENGRRFRAKGAELKARIAAK